MFFKSNDSKKGQGTSTTNNNEVQEVTNYVQFHEKVKQLEALKQHNPDLLIRMLQVGEQQVAIVYVKGSVNEQELNHLLIKEILHIQEEQLSNQFLIHSIPIAEYKVESDVSVLYESLLGGWIAVCVQTETNSVLFNLAIVQQRALSESQNESSVLGPNVQFTESLSTNTQVVRQILNNAALKIDTMQVGTRVPREIRIFYMDELADEQVVEYAKRRLKAISMDEVGDGTILAQLMEDKKYSIFPELLNTELPYRVTQSIMNGKIAILIDGSPMATIGPTSFFSFFSANDDAYYRWQMATFYKLLRLFGVFISITLTASYVAALTYHYEIIPSALLMTIGKSRANVPFPPVLEALMLEAIIDLVREAGARLPTKVGQTMGIVGAIVIGQATVSAGLTSNILIIIVAVTALASFTAPKYVFGTAMRIIRYPLIVLAGMYGLIGVVYGLTLLMIHLLRLTSLGRPFLEPIFPLRWEDFTKGIIFMPKKMIKYRPVYSRSGDKKKNDPSTYIEKNKDIDE
ncbi:spore germination protein [Priestia taiwanensis]|uniref:spore germination protein n=1 Tax=Priestia taiwanensis TaxID=1347902 RepID=UPI00166BEA05|nr:spore germination protein [Priestia taiwanensis]MBM7362079.1 chemotaxis receptor (MCP) glutamine deamidase CheD [Priestia taiwanensis]